MIQFENNIFPIEIKAGKNIKSKSLEKFGEKYSEETKLKIRFSLDNLKLDDNVLNIPLFMADYTRELIKMGLKGKI